MCLAAGAEIDVQQVLVVMTLSVQSSLTSHGYCILYFDLFKKFKSIESIIRVMIIQTFHLSYSKAGYT